MSEQNNTTRTFEDVIREKLTGKTQKNALDYVAFLKANGISGDGVFTFSGGYLCNIHRVDETGWYISMEHIDSPLCRHEYQDFPVDEKVKEFAWAHVSTCAGCGCGFNPGRRPMLFGKEFKNTCFGLMNIDNPDGEDLELLKKLTLVWKQVVTDASKDGKLYPPVENAWPIVRHSDAHAGIPLGKSYTKSLDVEFYITPRKIFLNHVAVGFSGGELVPTDNQQFPVALGIGASRYDRFEAIKGPAEGYTCVETLRFQQNVTYLVEMSINIADNTYDATVWMLNANGRPDTPYYIAKDFPFRLEAGAPPLKTIDTIYPVCVYDETAYIIRDFKVVGGE